MQVKKFEAPTIQEALDHVKRELGPEAIILQTKTNRRGFGLLSKGSVEVTAAVSERSLQKKQYVETRLPEAKREEIKGLPAEKQANLLEKYVDKRMAKASETVDRVDLGARQKKITATRYADIEDDGGSKPAQKPAQKPAYSPGPTKSPQQPIQTIPAPPQAYAAAAALQSSTANLEEEVRQLRSLVQELRKAQESSSASTANPSLESDTLDEPALMEAFDRLVLSGVDRKYAYALLKKVSFDNGSERCRNAEFVMDAVANEMMDTIEVSSLLSRFIMANDGAGPLVYALVGPTGVGKTSTVAKIAGLAQKKRKLKVGLINLDSKKEYAFDQLGTYAKILNLPFRSVSGQADLLAAVNDFKAMDLVLIDTPGRSYQDPKMLQETQSILSSIKDLQVGLILSVATRDSELQECLQCFTVFNPRSLVFSKLDETKVYGSIYNMFQKSRLPLQFFATGQKIPDDIEEASAERVASLVLRI